MATDPEHALSTGSPALAALMLSLGRLVLGRVLLPRRVPRSGRTAPPAGE